MTLVYLFEVVSWLGVLKIRVDYESYKLESLIKTCLHLLV
jgi:hypothetical protein